MTHGRLVLLTGSDGSCLFSPDFNGDMFPAGKNGGVAIEGLIRCKNRDDFRKVCLKLLKAVNRDGDFTKTELNEGTFLYPGNVIEEDFGSKGDIYAREYCEKWHSDYIYLLNLCGEPVTTKICAENHNDADHVFDDKTVTILHYGTFICQFDLVDETLEEFDRKSKAGESRMTAKKAAKILTEFNKWRRGEGVYEFNPDPLKNKQCPYTPKEIGKAIDLAVKTFLNKSNRG